MSKADPSVTHSIPHDLSLEMAGKVGRKAVNSYAKQYKQVSGRWETPYLYNLSAKAAFTTIKGTISINDEAIVFKIDRVPSMFKGFVGLAIDAINKEVKLWIRKAKRGEIK
jgi:hypothetical protein